MNYFLDFPLVDFSSKFLCTYINNRFKANLKLNKLFILYNSYI